ncbi:glycosyltransferase [Sphingomonas sp. dw_22]|uniref:glycosyltransferase n=1 Tax=Sphingomonas sp. dw_22 TaxID=2721175 RepID=UPI001BD6BCAF|nr:glycosyltransferase [Sphingomonas sp. dw_22]
MFIDKLKYRKSAGVPVSGKVHTILRAANDARGRGDHAAAVSLFREALGRDPSLAHVWIQYGHMLRKIGDYRTAEDAYREALRMKPDSDPYLHLGHLYKETGQIGSAARSYIAAVRANPSNGDALAELHMLMARNIEITPEDIMAITNFGADAALGEQDPVSSATTRARSALDSLATALRREGTGDQLELLETTEALLEKLHPDAGQSNETGGIGSGPAILFDVSDLISYFNGARLPTGIQRVQIEVIRSALRNGHQPLRICAFLDHRDEWVEIAPALFLLLCRLSLASGELNAPEWVSALTKLRLTMAMSEPLAFPRGAFLVNLGTSWWLQNYFLYVRQAKAKFGIHYVPFVHDVIPVMASEHCTKELTRDFISWAMGAFEHADYFFVNSEATKRDLLKVAATLGHEVAEEKVVVVRLDADFRKPVSTPLGRTELAKWGIGRSDFVLFISTVESRKNHIGAFDAWISLLREHGARRVPKLVCVGNKGWLNDAVYARLAAHDGLRERVVMLSGLSDAELDLLYRSCLFTLYPSNYEGWGLPVTESLCYGKVPLVSDASSLPEAGGVFAHYFEAGSTPRMTAALEQLIFEPAIRAEREAKIAEDFSPRAWDEIATQLSASMRLWAEDTQVAGDQAYRVPVATLGAYHPIVRNFATRIWPGMRSGEIFRAGGGWWGPDDWGCWTKAQGGTLEIGLPDDLNEGIRLYVQLHGLPTADCPWTANLPGAQSQGGVLPRGAFKWTSFELDTVPADRVLRLLVEGTATVDLRTVTEGLDPRVVSVGVVGFYLCRANDSGARSSFLEAVALSNLDNLAFNRERAGEPAIAAVSS